MTQNSIHRQKPIERSRHRARLGMVAYGLLRRGSWLVHHRQLARTYAPSLKYVHTSHKTLLLRPLKDLDMKYQYNKITNLRIAAKNLNGIVIHPGEIFSYWNLIGNPTKGKGYLEGMVLQSGQVAVGIGGGLCQLSNLIYWMALHTPLTVIERHRHGYDVFPDADRTQPFGSGATCCYPHVDLMLQNNTPFTFQLTVQVGEKFLHGAWRSDSAPVSRYEVIEKNHRINAEYWGGYTRCNELYRQTFDRSGKLLLEEKVADNSATMMYAPFIEPPA